MSAQETPPNSSGNQFAIPACPQCGRRMTAKQARPVLFASSVDDVTYRCDKCDTEVKRTVRRA
jgi:DNA-directed RNA polymerase subunit RPC12/RpoP